MIIRLILLQIVSEYLFILEITLLTARNYNIDLE